MKTCTKCGEIKNIKEFNWKIKAKNLRSSWCKSCQSKYDKQYYKINRDKIVKRCKRYQKCNLEKFREYNKRYRNRNLEKYRELSKISSKKYRENNLQKVRHRNRIHMAEYRKNNPDKIKDQYTRYNKENVEKIKKANKIYRTQNHAKIMALNARRKAFKRQLTPMNADKDVIYLYYKIAGDMSGYEVDHIKPLSKGGLHHEDNLQILSKQLNLEKSNKWPLTIEEQKKYTGFQINKGK